MRESELTPEDKLLEIIENPSQTAGIAPARTAIPVKNMAGFLLRLKNFKLEETAQKIKIGHVNKALIVLCILLTILGAWLFRAHTIKLAKDFDDISTGETLKATDAPRTPAKNVNFLQTLTLAKEHNIFTLQHNSTSMEGLLVGDGQATANLKLVGILWSEKPQAMIEDTVDQKTYLLNEGDQVARLLVKSIQKDKVVLAREDRVWELR
jgi:type II secretory pathway component PulC